MAVPCAQGAEYLVGGHRFRLMFGLCGWAHRLYAVQQVCNCLSVHCNRSEFTCQMLDKSAAYILWFGVSHAVRDFYFADLPDLSVSPLF